MSMFVDHLLEALAHPAGRLSRPGDDLIVDTARYRALLMSELRGRQEADALQGGELAARSEALALLVRDGSLDAYLYGVADGLIEMGVVRDQALLDQFLHAATLARLGVYNYLTPTDQLLLDLAGRPPQPGGEELDVRLMARRYAIQLGLLSAPQVGTPALRSELGDAVRRLPCELVLPFLITLEGLSCYGPADPWRAPAEAYQLLYERGEALLFTKKERQAEVDARGVWRAGRLRRWLRMGLCDAPPQVLWPAGCEQVVQLNSAGERALSEALRTPPAEVVRLCEQLFRWSRQQALRQLLPPEAAPPPRGRRPTVLSADVIRLETVEELFDADAHRAAPGGGEGEARRQKARAGEALRHGPPPLPHDLEAVDVEELCRATLRDLQANPIYGHVSFSLTVPPGTPREELRLPHGRRTLRMLLSELLTTAAGAVVRQSMPRILIELLIADGELCIILHDNGPGIPVSQRPRVFAETVPPGESAPRYLLGTVRRTLEESLHGRLEIAAPRLGGASFRLSLPRASARSTAAA